MMTVEKRYQTDPTFRALVDTIYNMITNAQFTPSELREAVILAATRYEMNQVRTTIFPHFRLEKELKSE